MSRPVPDGWKACPPGELGRLSSRLRSRRIRRNAARAGMALAAVTLLALGVLTFRTGHGEMKEFEFAGIRCSRVIALTQDYSMGKLEPRLSDQIKAHVEVCPRCHERFKAMGLISALWLREPLGVENDPDPDSRPRCDVLPDYIRRASMAKSRLTGSLAFAGTSSSAGIISAHSRTAAWATSGFG